MGFELSVAPGVLLLNPVFVCVCVCCSTEAVLDSTSVVGRADAGVVVDAVHTGGVILTVIVFAVIWVHLTSLALKARQTHTSGVGPKTDTGCCYLWWYGV